MRHFKDDTIAAKQAGSNSVLTITAVSLPGSRTWVIPKKSACLFLNLPSGVDQEAALSSSPLWSFLKALPSPIANI